MGYYTTFEVTVTPEPDGFAEALEELTGQCMDDGYIGDTKWYDCDKDILELSRAYTGCAFRVEGRGEEHGDHWVLYAKNGKSVKYKREEWTPPPFCEEDLE